MDRARVTVSLSGSLGDLCPRTAPHPDDPAQSKRFVDMAREVEAESSKEDLVKAFKKVAKETPKPKRD